MIYGAQGTAEIGLLNGCYAQVSEGGRKRCRWRSAPKKLDEVPPRAYTRELMPAPYIAPTLITTRGEEVQPNRCKYLI